MINVYFVFEGKTEAVVYREWLKLLIPSLSEVSAFDEASENNYYYESDMGVPDCYNVAANAIQEINLHPVYDYLVLIIDADRCSVEDKILEARTSIQNKLSNSSYRFKQLPAGCSLEIIVQNVCIETWFLGNRRFFVRNPQNNRLASFIQYYDVSLEDPEGLASEFIQSDDGTANIFGYSTKALFHEGYLREIFKERLQGVAFNKGKPKHVQDQSFLEQLQSRVVSSPLHLRSFVNLLNFCERLNRSTKESN